METIFLRKNSKFSLVYSTTAAWCVRWKSTTTTDEKTVTSVTNSQLFFEFDIEKKNRTNETTSDRANAFRPQQRSDVPNNRTRIVRRRRSPSARSSTWTTRTRASTHTYTRTNAASDHEGTMRSAYRACLPPTTPAGAATESVARTKKKFLLASSCSSPYGGCMCACVLWCRYTR